MEVILAIILGLVSFVSFIGGLQYFNERDRLLRMLEHYERRYGRADNAPTDNAPTDTPPSHEKHPLG